MVSKVVRFNVALAVKSIVTFVVTTALSSTISGYINDHIVVGNIDGGIFTMGGPLEQ